ncbi:MAG: protein-(glutamine-N5) methyltransferase, release factor-specific [Bacteroidetes bacterium 4572_77]|nr:MAG: protein-(glutamine-N5) methyltransferase, release factor-specific [Bacteroidetes bacterium 4572_77]
MRIASNQYKSIMLFALQELKNVYPQEEIKALVYYLFAELIGVSRSDYLLNPNKGVSESELLKFNFAIKDLKNGKPIQHILGYAYFLEKTFIVNKETLIPRPETEELVQYIISKEQTHKDLKILDIGTGTACIPISLGLAMPQHKYSALDFKTSIIDLAEKNAQKHEIPISFKVKDILQCEAKDMQEYDIIISNPPYVLESEKAEMHKNVLEYEPYSALYVKDNDALLFYKKIIELAKQRLSKKGRIYLEINENKATETETLLKQNGFSKILVHKDIHDKNRFVSAILNP